MQLVIVIDVLDVFDEGSVGPGSGGKLYVVELHVEFEVVVTVAFTSVHSLQTPIVGVTGHVQLLVGQLALGSVVLVLRIPFLIKISYCRRFRSKSADNQLRILRPGLAVVPLSLE